MKVERSILNSIGGKILAIFILVSILTIVSLTIISAYLCSRALRQNAENAIQATGLSKKAMSNAEDGNKQMQELAVAMGYINKSADEIKKIVKVNQGKKLHQRKKL